MVKNAFFISVFRQIKQSLGRFFAILIITGLGVGFFAGLRSTEPAMIKTGASYVSSHRMYNFKLVSTLGFTNDDVKEISNSLGYARGAYTYDILAGTDKGEKTIRVHSITDGINIPEITEGVMPSASNECVVDRKMSASVPIGSRIVVQNTNTEDVKSAFSHKEYIVTGYADSPMYLNFERGSSPLGNGTIAGFICIPEEGFTSDIYSEIYVLANGIADTAFSDEYDESASKFLPLAERVTNECAIKRYDDIREDKRDALDQYEATVNEERQRLEYAHTYGLIGDEEYNASLERIRSALEEITVGRTQIENMKQPTVYVFGRDKNTGYACFESDSSIVSAISVVFPLLFMLVAILVCMTTMTRMVDENRGEVGTLKSLGYSNAAIQFKFVGYAGVASFIGWIVGFFLGSYFVPRIIWSVYDIMYGFAEIEYVFLPVLFIVCLIAAVGCACGSAYLACRNALACEPAQLMRPKAPKAGKKILLERISPLWKKLSFLQKVSARNIFRYKNRLFMMMIGIGGCTALLVTGFGISDSIENIADFQFGEITKYDAEVFIGATAPADIVDRIKETDGVDGCIKSYKTSADLSFYDAAMSINVIYSDEKDFSDYFNMHSGKEQISYPANGEVTVSEGAAKSLGISVGDTVKLVTSDMKETELTVCGIFENFVNNYVVINADALTVLFGDAKPNTAFINIKQDYDIHRVCASVSEIDGVMNVSASSDVTKRVNSSLESIGSIVWFVLICAATLAFVVIYNLSNINIAERVREIATIKVLGFYAGEVWMYIFREIIALAFMGGIIGLPLGKLLHTFVMAQIKVDSVTFQNRISFVSYLVAFGLTMLFAMIVNMIMTPKLSKIDMSGSLKSVE
ncbi:MAG: ABC transporter permease [Eubacteriales bacterium]|nr:ABC transporter permease [Eubacteriales bacterium]